MKIKYYVMYDEDGEDRVVTCLMSKNIKAYDGKKSGIMQTSIGQAICSETEPHGFDEEKGKLIAMKRAEYAMENRTRKDFKGKEAIDVLMSVNALHNCKYGFDEKLTFKEKKILYGNPNYQVNYIKFYFRPHADLISDVIEDVNIPLDKPIKQECVLKNCEVSEDIINKQKTN